ncbi:MAG: hypothetical protein M3014_11990 [Chloroflexota bacterium]|nr:hypothetical protein [Chloroflexota bacterium]
MDNSGGRRLLGEIIATSYSSFKVESYELNSTPSLGALVIAQNVLGVVCAAHTEGLGPISAKGSLDGEDGSVYDLYPDLQRTLRSQFDAIVVGCFDETRPHSSPPLYTYPECPPHVHYKCWLGSTNELVRFTDSPDYIRLLLYSEDGEGNVDQVIIHLIVQAYRARLNDRAWLGMTAEYLGRQLKGQYDRLLAILKTLDALTEESRPTREELPLSVGKVKF